MVVNTKITVKGITYTDIDAATVSSSIGTNNSSSSFTLLLPNDDGQYKNTFGIGNEVIIYADKNTSPATTKIFTGLIENIRFQGQGIDENIVISGRDYTARLMDTTVEPEVYNNSEVSTIITDIITKYVTGITTTNVKVTTTQLNHIAFNQTPVFDAIKQLAELSNFVFWIDTDKDLHFEAKGQTVSGVTLNNTNVISSSFRTSDNELYNKVWVYGDRILSAWENDYVADGTGSVYTLDYRPYNTNVEVAGSATLRGGVFEMLVGAPQSGTEYLVDFDQRKIILCSGTQCGYNVATSGTAVNVNYNRSSPIIKYGENRESVDAYGPKTKVIVDKNITDPNLAKNIVSSTLVQSSSPVTQGNLKLQGVISLVAGQTIIVNMANQDISSETYDILEVKYDFSKRNCLSDEVLAIKVSKKLKNFVDTFKQLLLDVKKLQGADMTSSDEAGQVVFTRMQQSTGSFGLRVKNWYIKQTSLGSSFILGTHGPQTNPQYGGILGSVVISGINFLGTSIGSPSIIQSGGTF